MSSRSGGEPHALLAQDPGRDAALLPHQAEQDVLGADVVVEHALGFFGGVAEHALALGGERDLDGGRHLLAPRRARLDLPADLVHREMTLAEETRSEPLALTQQPQQHVLGLDGSAAELACLVAGEEDHTPRSLRVALEHPSRPSTPAGTARAGSARVEADHSRKAGSRERWPSPVCSGRYEPSALQPQHAVAAPGDLLVVGHDDRRSATGCAPDRAADRAASSRSRDRDRRLARRRAAGGASRPGRAPARPAAARRPRAHPACARAVRRDPPARAAVAPAPAPPARGLRARSSGIDTFSSAENSGNRWWNWNTNPSVRLRNAQRRASGSSRTLSSATVSEPASARSSVPSTCSSVDLPTPEAPTIATISPTATSRSTPHSTRTSPAGVP